VVFSPYLSLTKILESDAQLADLGQNAWAALNDVYRTDAPIIYAPYVLALGCLYLASVICSRDITAWLEGVDVDTNQVRDRDRVGWCPRVLGTGLRGVPGWKEWMWIQTRCGCVRDWVVWWFKVQGASFCELLQPPL
jgi:hypothetical protein